MSDLACQITGNLTVCTVAFLANNKDNAKAPLWEESTGHQWIPLTKGQ